MTWAIDCLSVNFEWRNEPRNMLQINTAILDDHSICISLRTSSAWDREARLKEQKGKLPTLHKTSNCLDMCSNLNHRTQRRLKWLFELAWRGSGGRNVSSKTVILLSSVVGLSFCLLQLCSEHGCARVHTSKTSYWCPRGLMRTTGLSPCLGPLALRGYCVFRSGPQGHAENGHPACPPLARKIPNQESLFFAVFGSFGKFRMVQ